jgi:hypothetical protein
MYRALNSTISALLVAVCARASKYAAAMARFRNIHKPGAAAYDAFQAAELRRRARLAQGNVKRAKRPQAIRKTERRAAAIERELAKVTARQEARAGLS